MQFDEIWESYFAAKRTSSLGG